MSSSTQIDLQSESILDAVDKQKQKLTEDDDGAHHQHIQPDDAHNKSESRITVKRFVNPYEEDEAKYFLVPPFAVPPICEPPEPETIRFPYLPDGITRKELDIIKLTAQFSGVYGMYFRRDLMKRVSTDPQFEFLKSADGRHRFYARLAFGYASVLMQSHILEYKGSSTAPIVDGFFKLLRLVENQDEGVEMAMTDLHAFEFFVNMEEKVVRVPPQLWNLQPKVQQHPLPSQFAHLRVVQPYCPAPLIPQKDLQSVQNKSESRITMERFVNPYDEDEAKYFLVPPFAVPPIWDPPQPETTRFPYLPDGITRKELDIIKLTAQFSGVYGMYFRRDLMKRVSTNPQFEFLKSTDGRHRFYARLALGYASVLMQSHILEYKGSSTAPIVDGFFKLLRLVENQEEGIEMAMTDLHAFEFFVNMEEKVVRVPPQLWNLPQKMNTLGMMRPAMPGMSPPPLNAST